MLSFGDSDTIGSVGGGCAKTVEELGHEGEAVKDLIGNLLDVHGVKEGIQLFHCIFLHTIIPLMRSLSFHGFKRGRGDWWDMVKLEAGARGSKARYSGDICFNKEHGVSEVRVKRRSARSLWAQMIFQARSTRGQSSLKKESIH